MKTNPWTHVADALPDWMRGIESPTSPKAEGKTHAAGPGRRNPLFVREGDNWHGSGGLFCRCWVAVRTNKLGRQMLASLDRQNSVSYSVRKFIRPLIHRLVSDAYCLGGSGDGTAQQFNGFCFEHALLNHSSDKSETIVHAKAAMICNYG